MKLSKAAQTITVLGVALVLALPTQALAKRKWEEQADDLNARLSRIERLLDSQGLQEMYQRLELLDQENRTLRGEVEQLNYQLEHMQERNRQLYLDMDQRLQSFESGQSGMGMSGLGESEMGVGNIEQAAPVLPGVAPTGGVTSAPTAPSVNGMSAGSVMTAEGEQGMYRSAFELLKQRDYQGAMKGFEGFLKSYGQSPLAPNAQYWLGEAAYGNGAYGRAAVEFERVVRSYPDSSKVDDASLKLGYSYYELKEYAKARTVLKDLMMRSTGSTVGAMAAERLKRMKREGH